MRELMNVKTARSINQPEEPDRIFNRGPKPFPIAKSPIILMIFEIVRMNRGYRVSLETSTLLDITEGIITGPWAKSIVPMNPTVIECIIAS